MKQFLPNLVHCRPILVFFQVGGNDIRIDSNPKQIAREKVELAETIAAVSGTKVVIGSLFRCERPRMPYEICEEIRDDVNFWCVFVCFPCYSCSMFLGPRTFRWIVPFLPR